MRFSKAWLWFSLGAILLACSPDPERISFAYLRSPSFFRADTTFTDHPFCRETHPFAPAEECIKAKKYQLTWVRPEDTANLIGYRIYLDTTDPRAPGVRWNDLKDKPQFSSIIVQSLAPKDTLVFVFGNKGFKQDTLTKGSKKIFILDSVGREDDVSGNLDFGLVPVYSGDATPGQPQFAYFQTRDKQPPDVFHPSFTPRARQVDIAWLRPTDRVSFFDPSQDTGLIRKYVLEVKLTNNVTLAKKNSFRPTVLSYFVGERDETASASNSASYDSVLAKYTFTLPDSNHSSKRTHPVLADSLHLIIGNLQPFDNLTYRLLAIDSSGNPNTNAMEFFTVINTDTTQPTKPVQKADSVSRNSFILKWSASRDLVEGDTGLIPGPVPNFNIREYHLTRILMRDSTAKTTSLDRVDTVVLIDTTNNGKSESFRIAMNFLPPGTTFSLRLAAFDRSGFESLSDTLTVRTDSVKFVGDDSALVCPKGFIPVPRGRFTLGDNASSSADERPSAPVVMGPYCIEPYEHRDSTGKRFVSDVTYDQAKEICGGIDTAFATQLCSEVEWERACKGPDATNLTHGIQSEGKDPSILQSSCNQGTNDSAMAMSFELRNSICLTTEGVYDMAGNLSEWVRDPYVANSYAQPGRKDTLFHDFAFSDTAGNAPHGIRGGNYLKTTFPQQSLTQNLARCSNRDFAAQVRPIYRPDCLDETHLKIAVIYGAGLTGHRCIDIDSTLLGAAITEIIPNLADTTGATLLAFVAGVKEPHTILLPASADTLFKGRKPISAVLTKRALAVVTFVSSKGAPEVVDTLDATEMRDTSQVALQRIFQREAANSEWTVKKADGKFAIKYLNAYTAMGTKPARPFYSSRVIGFRCCSLAKMRPLPVDTTVTAGP